MMENEPTKKIIEKECLEMIETIGRDHLRIDLIQTSNEKDNNTDSPFVETGLVRYHHVRVTHVPTGKVAIGDGFKTQIENLKEALCRLKVDLDHSKTK